MRHDLEQHRTAAAEAVTKAFEDGRAQGIAEGVAQERTRVKALLDSDLASFSPSPRRVVSREASKVYGNNISLVRPALRDIGEAVDARGLAELIGDGIDEKKVRNTLRQLVRTGEAVRAERGKYLWREANESPSAQKSGDKAPDPFNLAAE